MALTLFDITMPGWGNTILEQFQRVLPRAGSQSNLHRSERGVLILFAFLRLNNKQKDWDVEDNVCYQAGPVALQSTSSSLSKGREIEVRMFRGLPSLPLLLR